jgi:Cys-tRNA(Pro)/Cys-tRNA(Cys) deacylase
MSNRKKTNAIRLLDAQKISYQLLEYAYDPSNLDVGAIAVKNGLPVEQLYKTLVARGDKTGVLVALVPGDKVLDLKKLAKASHNKKVELVPVKQLQGLTGYIRGGCSPLGMKKRFPVFLAEEAAEIDFMYINAGIRGLFIGLHPQSLEQAADVYRSDITAKK